MTQHKNKRAKTGSVKLLFLGLIGLAVIITMLLQNTDIVLFNPKGFIASEQHRIMLLVISILLIIAIPTMVMLYFFAWKYRESNEKAVYEENAGNNKLFVLSAWAVPTGFMLILATIMWGATHRIQPQKAIASNAKPITIQVIAMRWKWIFIYPEQNIATVNFIEVPINTPIQFELTADETPMSSFWIPHWGGQLYAMTGHLNRLNLMAGQTGDFTGSSAEINGAGFAGMKFMARAGSQQDFDAWVQNVKQSPEVLDTAAYQNLLKPSKYVQSSFYSRANDDLYANLIEKYNGAHNYHTGTE